MNKVNKNKNLEMNERHHWKRKQEGQGWWQLRKVEKDQKARKKKEGHVNWKQKILGRKHQRAKKKEIGKGTTSGLGRSSMGRGDGGFLNCSIHLKQVNGGKAGRWRLVLEQGQPQGVQGYSEKQHRFDVVKKN